MIYGRPPWRQEFANGLSNQQRLYISMPHTLNSLRLTCGVNFLPGRGRAYALEMLQAVAAIMRDPD